MIQLVGRSMARGCTCQQAWLIGREAAQPVNLLDQESVAALGIGEQPEQLWAL
jgi:hypothetical protein